MYGEAAEVEPRSIMTVRFRRIADIQKTLLFNRLGLIALGAMLASNGAGRNLTLGKTFAVTWR
jgi:hypothetical protein